MTDKVLLDIDGAVAVITNNNPEKLNAFDDEMDVRLFEILRELRDRPQVRAVVWRGGGRVWSSGRDVSVIGHNATTLSHQELMTRGHQGILQLFALEVPVIAALHGWAIGGSFQRALLCDIRIAAEGTRFMLPEVGHGLIPDTGGVGRLFQICGPGLTADLVLTGRTMETDEALANGIVSRVVPAEDLEDCAMEMARKIAAAPKVTVRMARRVLQHLSEPGIRSSMADEHTYQTFITRSSDFAEFKAAEAEGRSPTYTGE